MKDRPETKDDPAKVQDKSGKDGANAVESNVKRHPKHDFGPDVIARLDLTFLLEVHLKPGGSVPTLHIHNKDIA